MMSHLPKWRKITFAGVTSIILAIGVITFLESQESGDIVPGEAVESVATLPQSQGNDEALFAPSEQGVLAPEEQKVAESFSNASLPKSSVILVPFLVQAPFANWDALHEDACEEASLLMIKHYLDNKPILSQADGDEEIREMVAYEEENGYGLSITLRELSKIASDHYSISGGRVAIDFTIDDLKKEIVAGRPVIIPASGKDLPNPNFRNGGPNYHMLVVTGYDEDEFITNDPGTKNGEGYRYKYGDLYDAVHDWDPGNISNGQKAYLVFD